MNDVLTAGWCHPRRHAVVAEGNEEADRWQLACEGKKKSKSSIGNNTDCWKKL